MKRSKITLTAPLLIGLLLAARFVSQAVHRRTPRPKAKGGTKNLAKLHLDQDIVERLPRVAIHGGNNQPMEVMNLVLLGNLATIEAAFVAAGWFKAVPASLWSLTRAQFALLGGGQYQDGPVTPFFVGTKAQAAAFQKPTELNQFKQRHHGRIWQTSLKSTDGRHIWMGQFSYDMSIKAYGPLLGWPPVHEIEPHIDNERDLVAHDLAEQGGKLLGYVRLHEAHEGKSGFGDTYVTDGRAAVVEVS